MYTKQEMDMSNSNIANIQDLPYPGSPSQSAANTQGPRNPVGVMTRQDGNIFRYVYLNTATSQATVAGAPCYFTGYSGASGTYTVSANVSDSAANLFAGVFLASGLTNQTYIFVQIAGYNPALVVSGSPGAGAQFVASTSATLTPMGLAEDHLPVAIALAAESGGTAPGIILAIQ
jgi:hypothetical protein